MSKKLKLPFMELHKELYEILSPEELKGIIGGLGAWDTNQGFLNNINEMISSGMFNYTGSAGYDSGFVDVSGSGGSGGFTGFNFGSNNGPGPTFFNFYSGTGSSKLMFSFGSASGSGPIPLVGNFGSGVTTSFTDQGGTNPKITIGVNGKTLIGEYKNGQFKLTLKVGL